MRVCDLICNKQRTTRGRRAGRESLQASTIANPAFNQQLNTSKQGGHGKLFRREVCVRRRGLRIIHSPHPTHLDSLSRGHKCWTLEAFCNKERLTLLEQKRPEIFHCRFVERLGGNGVFISYWRPSNGPMSKDMIGASVSNWSTSWMIDICGTVPRRIKQIHQNLIEDSATRVILVARSKYASTPFCLLKGPTCANNMFRCQAKQKVNIHS